MSKYASVGILLFIVVLVYLYRDKLRKIFQRPVPPRAPGIVPANPLNRALYLQAGMSGPEVSDLQRMLGIEMTGYFNEDTLNELEYQKCVSGIALENFATTTCPLPIEDQQPENETDYYDQEGIYSNWSSGAIIQPTL